MERDNPIFHNIKTGSGENISFKKRPRRIGYEGIAGDGARKPEDERI